MRKKPLCLMQDDRTFGWTEPRSTEPHTIRLFGSMNEMLFSRSVEPDDVTLIAQCSDEQDEIVKIDPGKCYVVAGGDYRPHLHKLIEEDERIKEYDIALSKRTIKKIADIFQARFRAR